MAQLAILNSSLQFLFVELLGRVGLGEGVLQYATYEMSQMYTIDARILAAREQKLLLENFQILANRGILPINQEISSTDRKMLDQVIFNGLGLTQDERDAVYEAVINLVETRLKKASSLHPKDRQKRSMMGNEAAD